MMNHEFLFHTILLIVPLVEEIIECPGDGGILRQKVVIDLILEEREIVDTPFRDVGIVVIEIDPFPPVDAMQGKARFRRVGLPS